MNFLRRFQHGFLRFLCGLAMLAPTIESQILDQPDLSISASRYPPRCAKIAATVDGVVVAAWVLQGADRTKGYDHLAVARSDDKGATWRVLYDGVLNADRIRDLSIAVSSGWDPNVQYGRSVFVAFEGIRNWNTANPIARHVALVTGPLDAVSWGPRLSAIHVCGQFVADMSRIDQPTSPCVALIPYSDRGQSDFMVAVSYTWPDDPRQSLHLNTPIYGTKGRYDANGRNVIDTVLEDFAFRGSMTGDSSGRGMYVAFERARGVEVAEFDPQSFRSAGGQLARSVIGIDHFAPHISAYNNSVMMTCLRGRLDPRLQTRELVAYFKERSNPFQFHVSLHSLATTPGPLVMWEGRALATAHCMLDNVPGSSSAAFGFTWRGSYSSPQLMRQRVGDQAVASGIPSVARIASATDQAVFAWPSEDNWVNPPRSGRLLVDVGQ